MTLEGLNTEGVLIFANITKCKAYYSDKEFDYNYPEGLSELVQHGIVHIITTDEAVEVVNFAFDTDEIDLDMWDYHDSYNYLKVDEGDEIRAISHADFTQMCHHYKGDLEAFVDSSLTLKNILNPGFEKTKDEYFKYELPLIALPVGTWKINVYSLKDENVLGWMEFYMHLEKTVTIDVAKIALKPLEIYA